MKIKYGFEIDTKNGLIADEDDPKYILLSKHGNTYRVFGTYDKLRTITDKINQLLDEARND